MSWPALALALSAAAYLGFQATIRVVVYPQFANVGPADFPRYEVQHQRRVSVVVGPLFAALVASTGAVVLDPPSRSPVWLVWMPVVLLAVILGPTALFAVSLHARLAERFDPRVHRRLLAVDSVRLAAAVLDTMVAIALVSRAG